VLVHSASTGDGGAVCCNTICAKYILRTWDHRMNNDGLVQVDTDGVISKRRWIHQKEYDTMPVLAFSFSFVVYKLPPSKSLFGRSVGKKRCRVARWAVGMATGSVRTLVEQRAGNKFN
jgi:hypothetical protein